MRGNRQPIDLRTVLLNGASLLFCCGLLACDGSREAERLEPIPPERSETGDLESAPAGATHRVWLDVDPAIGLERREVDDGVFLLQAFHSPEMEIAGVSVVFGNTSLENAIPIARDVVARFGPPGLEVSVGASSAEQLGEETEATRDMAAALERASLSLLAVGPVTNAGSLLLLHPELHQRIEQIVVVAGRRVGQSFRVQGSDPDSSALRDFNFELDPKAMQVLLDSEIPLVLAPFEVSSHVFIRQADLDDLAARSAAGQWMAEATASWIALWNENFGVDGFNPFDTLAAAWITHPQLLEGFDARIWIEEAEDDTQPGSGATKPYLLVDPEADGGRRAHYLYRPDASFRALLKDRIAGGSGASP